MSEIFVTGHRNPDTDSIVASIAYANLRNSLGDREYRAVRIGEVNDETARMLRRFGFAAPEYIQNMRTQVCDIDFDRPPALNPSVPLDLAWRTMREGKLSTIPIVYEDGTLYGTLSAGDIATYDMQTIYNSHIDEMPIFNLMSVLEGQFVNEYSNLVNSVSGDVYIALPLAYEGIADIPRESIVVCGNQPEVIDELIGQGVGCLILCQAGIERRWIDSTENTCIISTPLDPRKAARVIYQAAPVSRACETGDMVCFHLSDYIDDVKEMLLESRYRCYPVLDEQEHVVGTLSRYHLLRPRRKRVVLVDHNEVAQSVIGLDQVEITEIIDHHRLADIQTLQPISMRNEPVGSTTTIITSMYQEHGVIPSPALAGLMASAILSDTVMFKSPTCTKKDIAMAERLMKLARLTLSDISSELFSASGSENHSAEDLLMSDYKQFHIAEQNIGVGQITCADSVPFLTRRSEFLETMTKVKKAQRADLIILMITDVLTEGTYLLYVGSDDVITQAFSASPKDNGVFLPGVMSRKKQIIPMLTALWG